MKKILIADDDDSLRFLLSEIISISLDCEVLEAKDGTEALEMIRAHKPNIVFLDYYMPGYSGMEIVQKIKDEDNKPFIILLTGITDKDEIASFKELGIDLYISKPFMPQDIFDLIDKI